MSSLDEDTNQIPAQGTSAPRRPVAPPRKTPLWARLLILGAFGCAGFALFCIALFCAGVWWLVSPPPQVATRALVAPSSIGVAHIGALADDPGLRAALQHVSDELAALEDERMRRDTPEWLRRMQGEQRGVPLGIMMMVVPEEVTLVIERLPGDGRLGWALAANFPWFVRPVKWAFPSDGPAGRKHSVDGVRIIESPDGTGVAFVGGTLVLTSDLETMRIVIPRLKSFRPGDEAAPRAVELPRMHEGWDTVGLLTEVRGDRAALLELIGDARARRTAERVLAADLSGLELGIDLETADRVRARLVIEAVDQLTIEDWAADLDVLLEEWKASAEAKSLRLESRVDLQRDEIRVELTLDGVQQWIADRVRNGGW